MKKATQTQLSHLVFDFLDEVAVFPTTTYSVDVRLSAIATIEIEASSEEEAIEKAEAEAVHYITNDDIQSFDYVEVMNASEVNSSAREAVDKAKVTEFVNDFIAVIEAEKAIDDAMN